MRNWLKIEIVQLQPCAATDSHKTVVYIDEFDADVFKQVLEYIHTGSTVLDPSTVVGRCPH